MNRKRAILAMLVLAVAASAQTVRYNYAYHQDFTKLRTYVWAEQQDQDVDQITDQQLRSAVATALAKKGFVLLARGLADLLLCYQASVTKERDLTLYNTGWGYGRGWRFSPDVTSGVTSTIRVGEFALDVYAMKSKQLLWRGVASDTLPPSPKPKQRQKQLDEGAAKLLKHFPPPAE